MEKEYIQVSFENGNIEKGKAIRRVYGCLILKRNIRRRMILFLQRSTGRLRELYLQLTEDCRISFITTRQQEGMAAYRRSMTLLLLKALYHQAGHENTSAELGSIFPSAADITVRSTVMVTLDQDFLDVKWKPE